VPPPYGIVFRTPEGVWIVKDHGKTELLGNISPEADTVQFCSTGEYILVGTYETSGEWAYSAIEVSTEKQVDLNPGKDQVFCYAEWWPGRCDTIMADVQPWLEVGRYCQSIPAVLDLSSNLSFIGNKASIFSGVHAPSPDGKLVAFTQDAQPWIYRWGIGSQPLTVQSYIFPLINAGFIRPTWSPDNSQVAWLVWGEMNGEWTEGIGIFDLKNNHSLFSYPHQVWAGEFPSYLFWNPHKDYILLDTPDGHMSVLNLDGSEQYSVESAMDPKWSPDGQWLTYALVDNRDRTVYVRSADGEELHKIGPGVPIKWSPESRFILYRKYEASIWIAEVGVWNPERVNLPDDAVIMDWIGLK